MVDAKTHSTRSHRRAVVAVLTVLATLIVGSASVLLLPGSSGVTHAPRTSATQLNEPLMTHALVSGTLLHLGSIKSAGATAPAASTVAAAAVAPPPVPTVPVAVAQPSIATLVTEAEASGVDPGSNWTWSMGDPATHCGVISGTGTGCTYGEAGREYTIFAGTPTLALVAHEIGNAETQNDAIPSLLSEVAATASGTSWSPTDAVASCLVAHFMGFQDDAAGSWQCPAALAAVVADHIHDTY